MAEKVSALIGEVPWVVRTWRGCVGKVGGVAISKLVRIWEAANSNGDGSVAFETVRLLLVGHTKHSCNGASGSHGR